MPLHNIDYSYLIGETVVVKGLNKEATVKAIGRNRTIKVKLNDTGKSFVCTLDDVDTL